jgi:hypothetical protein
MCGRHGITTAPEAMRQLFEQSGPLPHIPTRYNVAPTQAALVARLDQHGGDGELGMLRWAPAAYWSCGPDCRCSMNNARADTITTKPALSSRVNDPRNDDPVLIEAVHWQKLRPKQCRQRRERPPMTNSPRLSATPQPTAKAIRHDHPPPCPSRTPWCSWCWRPIHHVGSPLSSTYPPRSRGGRNRPSGCPIGALAACS